MQPNTIAEIKVTATVKEGKTIFRLEPDARAQSDLPGFSPLLAAFGGHHGPVHGCMPDAMFRLTALMATGLASR